jgi:hypothetical protein
MTGSSKQQSGDYLTVNCPSKLHANFLGHVSLLQVCGAYGAALPGARGSR